MGVCVCVCVCVCPGWPRSHCFLCSHPEFRQGWSEELLGSSTFTTTIIPASDPAVSLSLRVPWGVRQQSGCDSSYRVRCRPCGPGPGCGGRARPLFSGHGAGAAQEDPPVQAKLFLAVMLT